MKTFILVSFFSVTTLAQVYFKSVPLCTSWRSTTTGYVCSGYPMSEYIPDQFSLNNKISTLENRITALELKLAQIESLLLQQQKAQ